MATTGGTDEHGNAPSPVATNGRGSPPGKAVASVEPATAEEPPADSAAAQLADLDDRWRRAVADLDNFRKRRAEELRRERETERARVARAWLAVLDNLELALEHADADPTAIVQGVRATRDQAVQLLAGLGYPRNDETGVPFDPTRHEVVAVVDDPTVEPSTVTRVVRPGYGTQGNELRPTAVTVSRPQSKSGE